MQPLPSYNIATNAETIIKGTPHAMRFEADNFLAGESLATYAFRAALKNSRGEQRALFTESAGIVRLSNGILIQLTATQTDQQPGTYALVVEIRNLTTGQEYEPSFPVSIIANQIT